MSEKTAEEILELAQERIKQREELDESLREQLEEERFGALQPWRYAFIAMLTVLLVGLLFTPGFTLAEKMHIVLHGMCSQENDIILGGIEFPICARCSGIYISTVITMVYFILLGKGRAGRVAPLPIVGVMIFFVIALAIDGFHSMASGLGIWQLYEPRNEIRSMTGIGLGVGLAVLLLLMINTVLRNNANDDIAAFSNWREFIGALAVNFLVMVAIYGNMHLLALPLATLAFFGMVSVIYMVNLLLVSLLLGYDGAVSRLEQLAKPAVLAIFPTLIMLGGTSWFRFWLEGQGILPTV